MWRWDLLFRCHLPPGFFDDGKALAIRFGVVDPAVREALTAGKVVVLNPAWARNDGTVHVRVTETAGTRVVKSPVLVAKSRPGLAEPIYPPSVAAVLGVSVAPAGIFVSTTRMPTQAEARTAATAVDAVTASWMMLERGRRKQFPIGCWRSWWPRR